MKRTLDQNRRLHALKGELMLDHEVFEDLVYQFTGGRETSSKEMLMEECQAMINHLSLLTKDKGVSPEAARADKMRKKIISICHEMNLKLDSGKIDMHRVNYVCQESTYLKKKLDQYTLSELPKLVTQFEQILKSFYAKR